MAKAAKSPPAALRQHPLVGYDLRAYGAADNSLGPRGTVLAVVPTACPEVGNLALVQLTNGGTLLLPLTRLATRSDTWAWALERLDTWEPPA